MDPNNQTTNDQIQQIPAAEPVTATMAPQPQSVSTDPPTNNSTPGIAIAALVAAFLFSIVGLVLSIIALAKINKEKRQGKIIAVIALILSILGMATTVLLVALVFSNFSNVKNHSLNIERETDISALRSELESFYAVNENYPTLAEINSSTWRKTNFRNIEAEAYIAPVSASAILTSTPSKSSYAYEPRPVGCNNTSKACTGYALSTRLEDGSLYSKNNL